MDKVERTRLALLARNLRTSCEGFITWSLVTYGVEYDDAKKIAGQIMDQDEYLGPELEEKVEEYAKEIVMDAISDEYVLIVPNKGKLKPTAEELFPKEEEPEEPII